MSETKNNNTILGSEHPIIIRDYSVVSDHIRPIIVASDRLTEIVDQVAHTMESMRNYIHTRNDHYEPVPQSELDMDLLFFLNRCENIKLRSQDMKRVIQELKDDFTQSNKQYNNNEEIGDDDE